MKKKEEEAASRRCAAAFVLFELRTLTLNLKPYKRLRLKYHDASDAGAMPPSFLLFCNFWDQSHLPCFLLSTVSDITNNE